jgi:uncharacterized protein (TIGR02246 family)
MTVADDGTDERAEHDAIRDLLAAYAICLDADDVDGCLELFSDDGEFAVYGKTLIGRERIGRMFTRAPKGLHMIGGSRVEARGLTATVRSQVLFVEAGTRELRPALYDDELINVEGQWRFRRRRCQFITAEGLSDAPQEAQTA